MIHATVFAKHFQRMLEFYRLFGFRPERIEPNDFAVLSDGASELTIVQIPEQYSRDITIADPPVVRSETPIKLTFVVRSLDEAVRRATANGGSTAGFERWAHDTFTAQECVDPEGNVVQLREIH